MANTAQSALSELEKRFLVLGLRLRRLCRSTADRRPISPLAAQELFFLLGEGSVLLADRPNRRRLRGQLGVGVLELQFDAAGKTARDQEFGLAVGVSGPNVQDAGAKKSRRRRRAECGGAAGYAAGTTLRLRTETTYDDHNRVATETTNIRQVVAPNGTVTKDYSAAETTTYRYDQVGNLLQTTFPAPGGSLPSPTTAMAYDALGRETSETNAMGRTRAFQYNPDGRLSAVGLPAVPNPQNANTPANPTYQYSYDASGNKVQLGDPLGRTTGMTYDERGNLLSRTLPIGVAGPSGSFTETFRYDDLGRQTLHVSFEGAVTQSLYDTKTGRLTQQQFFPSMAAYNNGAGTPSETWTYAYDAYDRGVSATHTAGTASSTTTTIYDANGKVASITSPQGVVNYSYDPATGLRTRTYTTDPNNPSTVIDDIHYTYDVMGRLSTVQVVKANGVAVSPAQTTTDKYDLIGNLREEDDPNGSVVDYLYDNLNRLTEEVQYAPDGTTKIADYAYTLEADGKRTAATETFWWNASGVNTAHANNLTWTYDALGRLTDEALSSYDPTLSYADHFTLDLVGNQLSEAKNWTNKPHETIANTFDANDRLLTSTDTPAGGTATTTTFSYGPGNAWTVEIGEAVVTGSVTTKSVAYSYNLQGQLSVATVKTFNPTTSALASDQQTTYDYDASGNRVSALLQTDTALNGTYDKSVLTQFLIDPLNETGFSQVLRQTTTDQATGQVQNVVDYAIGLDLISQTTTPYTSGVAGTPQTLVFGYDGHGSVRVLLDMTAAIATVAGVQQLFHYDAYGNLLNLSAAQAATLILYAGEMLDAVTSLYDNRARWYDPQTGRFTQFDSFFGNVQDPQTLHKYLYGNADPVNGSDPSGHEELGSLLASISIGNFVDQQDNSQSLSGLHAGYRLKRTIEIFQKALQIYNKIEQNLQRMKDLIDMVRVFTTGDLTPIISALASKGLGSALSLPATKVGAKIPLPEPIAKVFNKIVKTFSNWGVPKNKIQEIVGEIGLAVVLKVLGFKVSPFDIHESQGPDQIARHKSGIWGIFEAKGGALAKLGKASYGRQMGGPWISHWIKEVINNPANASKDDISSLKAAYYGGSPMLAGIVKLVSRSSRTAGMRFAFQSYRPPNGTGMASWGDVWIHPTYSSW